MSALLGVGVLVNLVVVHPIVCAIGVVVVAGVQGCWKQRREDVQ